MTNAVFEVPVIRAMEGDILLLASLNMCPGELRGEGIGRAQPPRHPARGAYPGHARRLEGGADLSLRPGGSGLFSKNVKSPLTTHGKKRMILALANRVRAEREAFRAEG